MHVSRTRIQSVQIYRYTKQLVALYHLWYGAPCHKQDNSTSFIKSWNCYRTELQNGALLLCSSTNWKLFGRHDMSGKSCSSSLCRCCTSKLKPKAVKPSGRENKSDSPTFKFASFNSLWLLLMRYLKDFVFHEPLTFTKTKKENQAMKWKRWRKYIDKCLLKQINSSLPRFKKKGSSFKNLLK